MVLPCGATAPPLFLYFMYKPTIILKCKNDFGGSRASDVDGTHIMRPGPYPPKWYFFGLPV